MIHAFLFNLIECVQFETTCPFSVEDLEKYKKHLSVAYMYAYNSEDMQGGGEEEFVTYCGFCSKFFQ